MRTRETRSFGSFLDVRTAYSGAPKLTGHAAVFDSFSRDLGGFVERIRPGAFSRAISERQDVRCLWNHSSLHVLGRTKAGTLRLAEDAHGLRIECDLPDTSTADDLRELIGRGDVDQMSFAFITRLDEWTERIVDGRMSVVRELQDVDLFDVSPVTFPAYENTRVTIQRARNERLEMVLHPERGRLRRLKNENRLLKIEQLTLQCGGRY
jgi:hypothetical protein